MILQFNVPIKVIDDESVRRKIHIEGEGYFLEKDFPYIGHLIIYQTNDKELARRAHKILTGIEGIVVLPVTESNEEVSLAQKHRNWALDSVGIPF
jgi:hypothetical protein